MLTIENDSLKKQNNGLKTKRSTQPQTVGRNVSQPNVSDGRNLNKRRRLQNDDNVTPALTTVTINANTNATKDNEGRRPTLAEVMLSSDVPKNRMRHIQIADDANPDFGKTIIDDESLKSDGVISAVRRRDDLVTVKFAAANVVDEFEKTINTKYGDKVKIQQVRPYQPTMKIVGFNDMSTPMSEIVTRIATENAISPGDLNLVREYTVDASRRVYRNSIIHCSTDVLTKAIITGLSMDSRFYRCFEHVRTLQCFNCFAFGHIASSCVNKIACRKCAGEHHQRDCTDSSNEVKCII